MIEGLIKTILKKVKEEYPHIATPSIFQAKITTVKKLESYEKEIVIEWEGQEKQCKVKDYYYAYNIKIINENGNVNTKYPDLPNIRCKEKYDIGDYVTIALVEGEMNPVIVGG